MSGIPLPLRLVPTLLCCALLLGGSSGCAPDLESDAQQLARWAEADGVAGTSLFLEPPQVSENPQRRAPLVAVVEVYASRPVHGSLQVSDDTRTWNCAGPEEASEVLQLVAHSMRPGRTHEIRVQLTDPETGRVELSEPVEFTTLPLPSNFPPLRTEFTQPERVEPGVVLFPVNYWYENQNITDYGFLVAVDEEGEVVWFLHTGMRTADVRRLSNGNLLFQHGTYRYAFEVDLLGNIVRQWHTSRLTEAPSGSSIAVDIDTMHHELVEHPRGTLFTLATHLIEVDDFPSSVLDPEAPRETAHVVTDHLVEFDPETGEVLRRIDLRQFLDTERFGYLSLGGFWMPKYNHLIDGLSRDWCHANGLVLFPEEEAALISFRHLDCLIKIDLKQEKLLWILGDPEGWGAEWQEFFLTPNDPEFEWFAHQHGPQWEAGSTPGTGTLRLYDNGNYRARPYTPPLPATENSSRVLELQINERERTVALKWSYDGSPDAKFFCPFYCEADRLPQTGNLLITNGGHIELADGTPFNEVPGGRQWARIFEIRGAAPHETVFDLRVESPLGAPNGWSIYRSLKLPSLSVIRVDYELIPDPVEIPETPDVPAQRTEQSTSAPSADSVITQVK